MPNWRKVINSTNVTICTQSSEAPLTLLDALAQAGGPTRQAKNQILLIRGGVVKKYKYSDLKTLAPTNLEPGDTVEVPTSVW